LPLHVCKLVVRVGDEAVKERVLNPIGAEAGRNAIAEAQHLDAAIGPHLLKRLRIDRWPRWSAADWPGQKVLNVERAAGDEQPADDKENQQTSSARGFNRL
jgi:hypothetical protein